MVDLAKSLVMIALFVLPVALVALALVCFGRCISEMLDDHEYTSPPAEQPPN